LFTYDDISLSISSLTRFQISLMFICSHVISVSFKSHRMWSIIIFALRRRQFWCIWYVVLTGVLRLARVCSLFSCLYSFRKKVYAFHCGSWFSPIFLIVLIAVWFSSTLLNLAESTFFNVEFICLVPLWLPRLLYRYLGFHVTEPIKVLISEGFWSIIFCFCLFSIRYGHLRAKGISEDHCFLFEFCCRIYCGYDSRLFLTIDWVLWLLSSFYRSFW
jgi:hypothetical protein